MSTDPATTASETTIGATPAPEPAKPPKSSKLVALAGLLASGAIMVAGAAKTWEYFSTKEANSLIAETKTHFEQATAIHDQAVPKFKAYTAAVDSFPDNRAELERQGRELAEMYSRSAEQYRLAASKAKEAAEKVVDTDIADNFKARANYLNKCAETRDSLGKYVLLVTEPKVKSPEDLKSRQAEVDARIVVLDKEENELEAIMTKSFSDHSSKFE